MNGRQLADKAGVTYRQMDYWTRCKYIKPKVATPGSGLDRDYVGDEVDVAVAMAALVEFGFNPKRASEIARRMVGSGTVKSGEYLLVRVRSA